MTTGHGTGEQDGMTAGSISVQDGRQDGATGQEDGWTGQEDRIAGQQIRRMELEIQEDKQNVCTRDMDSIAISSHDSRAKVGVY